jgi:polar amino acid transport system substrate-binding protein
VNKAAAMLRLTSALLIALFMTACAAPPSVPAAVRAELAPSGTLRAGVSFSNVLLTTLGPNGEQGGVAVELARELARRLEVPLEIISFKSAGLAADAARSGGWDISVLGAEPQRAQEIDFATPLTQIEATYLVPAGSKLQTIADVDRPGIRIAVPAKSA